LEGQYIYIYIYKEIDKLYKYTLRSSKDAQHQPQKEKQTKGTTKTTEAKEKNKRNTEVAPPQKYTPHTPHPAQKKSTRKNPESQAGKVEAKTNPHPIPQEQNHHNILPLPIKDGLHFPLIERAGTSRALSQEPLPT